MKLKLEKAITFSKKENGIENTQELHELELDQEKFTAGVIINSEKEFLMKGGIFPAGDIHESREFCLLVASKMLGMNYYDLERDLSGKDFINLTNHVKGFFGGSGQLQLVEKILEQLR